MEKNNLDYQMEMLFIMSENLKKKKITQLKIGTIKRLFALSGNLCYIQNATKK